MDDPVNHPSHYTQGAIECITVLEQLALNYHLSCAIKYIWRHRDKHGLEDLKKAQWYLNRAIENMEKEQEVGPF